MAQDMSQWPKKVAHDQTPSQISDHSFEPKGEWYTLCTNCNLAESAHKETTLPQVRYRSDDISDKDY